MKTDLSSCSSKAEPLSAEAAPRSQLLAPAWHTVLLLFYFLVPGGLLPGLSRYLNSLLDWSRFLFYIIDIELKWLVIVLVVAGVYLNDNRVRDLIGSWPRSWPARRTEFYLAGLFWLLAILLSVVLLLAFGHFYPAMPDLHPHTWGELMLFLILVATAGFGEELIFRGYLLKQFQVLGGNFLLALLGQAIVFSLAHGYYQTLAGMADKFLFAVMLGLLANWRKSLFPGILAHCMLNITVSVLAFLGS